MNRSSFVQYAPGAPWTFQSGDAGQSMWQHPSGDVASFHFFDLAPDLAAVPNASGMAVLRQMYRDALAGHGGIVSVEPVTISSIPSIATIFKLPQDPSGMTYIASITVPFRDCSFVVKIQCPEMGITGLRDTTIFAKLSSELELGDDGVPRGWIKDPYLATCDSTARYNLSDQIQYDAHFFDHPLSRARRHLASVVDGLEVNGNALNAPKFGDPVKPFWKFW
jgi:hypothetical protein